MLNKCLGLFHMELIGARRAAKNVKLFRVTLKFYIFSYMISWKNMFFMLLLWDFHIVRFRVLFIVSLTYLNRSTVYF